MTSIGSLKNKVKSAISRTVSLNKQICEKNKYGGYMYNENMCNRKGKYVNSKSCEKKINCKSSGILIRPSCSNQTYNLNTHNFSVEIGYSKIRKKRENFSDNISSNIKDNIYNFNSNNINNTRNINNNNNFNGNSDNNERGESKRDDIHSSMIHFSRENPSSENAFNKKNKFLKTKCILKKINGEIKELNVKDIKTKLPNYVPYHQKTESVTTSLFKNKKTFSSTPTTIESITNLPIVYDNVHMNTDLVKKCRQASQNKLSILRNCNWSNKILSKIKLPVGKNLNSQSVTNTRLKRGEFQNSYNEYLQNISGPTFNPLSNNVRSVSCHHISYCNDNNKEQNTIRSVSQKLIFCNTEVVYDTPVGEAKFRGFQDDLIKLESVQKKDALLFHSSQVRLVKSVVTPDMDSLKDNLTGMVLKHSKNMILSKLKSLKNNNHNNFQYRHNSSTRKSILKNKAKISKWNSTNSRGNSESHLSDRVEKEEVCSYDHPYSLEDYNEKLNNSKKLSCNEGVPLFGNSAQDVTVERLLAEKPKIKSIQKKKCIEKISCYKVIHKSDDFISIYKNEGERTRNEPCIDVSSLLCKPGYVGNYLCESNSTKNYCHAMEEDDEIASRNEEEGVNMNTLYKMKKKKKNYNNNNNNNSSNKSDNNNSSNKSDNNNNSEVDNNLTSTNNYELNEKLQIDEYGHIQEEYNTQYNFENDEILYHLRKAVICSPTLNLDLQYITLFDEIL
ncbi:conserved Plasmodium protein, unknown function [Plasmodium malariae]|uniref:Uncharacterized protein n=1 Tax=Plasmodium malariae TaxID=5858 RepID=A0A1C3KD81_PLAMA|nr:conserved Plasmodium protein, unknown function [Plasmodium malariae]